MNLEEEARSHHVSFFNQVTRVFGFLGIAFAAAEIGIGVTIFQFLTNIHIGAWYVGVAIITICLLGLVCEKSATLCIVSCLSIAAIIVGLVGSIIDGIFWTIFSFMRGCYEPYSDSYYGENPYAAQATSCSSYSAGDSSSKGSCYCVQAGNSFCFHYTLANPDKYDCDDVLHLYTDWLHDSTIICSILTVGCLIYTIFLCTGGCMNIFGWGRPPTTTTGNNSFPVNNTRYPGFYDNNTMESPLISAVAYTDYETMPEVAVDHFQPVGSAPPFVTQGVVIGESTDLPYNPDYNPKRDIRN